MFSVVRFRQGLARNKAPGKIVAISAIVVIRNIIKSVGEMRGHTTQVSFIKSAIPPVSSRVINSRTRVVIALRKKNLSSRFTLFRYYKNDTQAFFSSDRITKTIFFFFSTELNQKRRSLRFYDKLI